MRSGLEARVLDYLDKKGVAYEYEPKTFKWRERIYSATCDACGGKSVYKHRTYLPDVILGNFIILEIKGRFTARDRKLVDGVRSSNPEVDLRMVFDRNNKLSPKSNTRYSEWCEQRGIKYCLEGKVPRKWLYEKKVPEPIK